MPRRWWRKLSGIALTITTFLSSTILTTVTSCGYKMPFYNFEGYMSNQGIESIQKTFQYAEFGDVEDFEQIIDDNKAIGGITNVYSIALMVSQGLVQRINFKDIFGINYDGSNQLPTQEIQDEIQNLYTSATWKYLSFYDDYLHKNNFLDKNDHFYYYVVPYFMQSKVIAYNIHRGNNPGKSLFDENQTYPYESILKTLHENGYKNLGVNNYIRDNLMIGSTQGSSVKGTEKKMDNELTPENYKLYTNNFCNLINRYFPGDKHNYDTDGTNLLLKLIDPTSSMDCEIIYNGDAMDAYYANANFTELTNGADVRVVYPTQPVYQLDGLMVVKQKYSNASNNEINDLYANCLEGFLNGASSEQFLNYKNNIINSALYKNYQYVKYNMPYEKMNEYIKRNFFNPESSVDQYALNHIYDFNINSLSINTTPLPIIDRLLSLIKVYYNAAITN